MERRLAAIERRLEAVESSLDEAVAKGLQTAGEEMRRAVSDLGRLLLRDLDRLTKVLAEHRDTIVERLRPETAAGAEPVDEAGGLGEAGPPAEPPEPVLEADGTRPAGEKGGWNALPPRRRRRRKR